MLRRARKILRIGKNNSLYEQCDHLSKISKQLYNVGLYIFRQALIKEDRWISNKEVYQLMKQNENWVLLPRKVSNQVWSQVCKSWKSWLNAIVVYKKNPSGFLGRPRMPKYKSDRNILIYETGAIGKRGLKNGWKRLSQTDIIFDSMGLDIVEAKIIPKGNHYIISIVYNKEEIKNENLISERVASFDLGLNNLVAIATNQADISHRLVNGRYLKSINRHWNKTCARLKSQLPKNKYWSQRLERLTQKKMNTFDTYLHRISRKVIDWLVENQIGTIIIGQSKGWKNKINIGRKTNQKFVQLPHARLLELLQYKFEEIGGHVIFTEESYTSKASALDLNHLPKYKEEESKPVFSGRRVKRGLYKTSKGYLINADINGALNIMRKVIRNSIDDLISDKQFIHNCTSPSFLEINQ